MFRHVCEQEKSKKTLVGLSQTACQTRKRSRALRVRIADCLQQPGRPSPGFVLAWS